MNILLLGSGGREHAIAAKVAQSKRCSRLYIAPGNAGTAAVGVNVNLNPEDFEAVGRFVVDRDIEMLIVGPEAPLVAGIADYFATTPELADVMVIGKKEEPAWSESIAMKLRELGIRTDSYVGEKGTGQQFAYAEKNGIPYVVTSQVGNLYSVKEIATRRVIEGMTLQDIALLAKRAE